MSPEDRHCRLVRIDAWLQKVQREHAVIFNLIAVGLGLLFLAGLWWAGLLK
jgi:hypothetical protein